MIIETKPVGRYMLASYIRRRKKKEQKNAQIIACQLTDQTSHRHDLCGGLPGSGLSDRQVPLMRARKDFSVFLRLSCIVLINAGSGCVMASAGDIPDSAVGDS